MSSYPSLQDYFWEYGVVVYRAAVISTARAVGE